MWVVNAPHPAHRAGQCPSRNGFSGLRYRGRFSQGGGGTVGQQMRIPCCPNDNVWVRMWVAIKIGGISRDGKQIRSKRGET